MLAGREGAERVVRWWDRCAARAGGVCERERERERVCVDNDSLSSQSVIWFSVCWLTLTGWDHTHWLYSDSSVCARMCVARLRSWTCWWPVRSVQLTHRASRLPAMQDTLVTPWQTHNRRQTSQQLQQQPWPMTVRWLALAVREITRADSTGWGSSSSVTSWHRYVVKSWRYVSLCHHSRM